MWNSLNSTQKRIYAKVSWDIKETVYTIKQIYVKNSNEWTELLNEAN